MLLNTKFIFSFFILFVPIVYPMEQAEGPIQQLPRDLIGCVVRTAIGGLPCSPQFTLENCQYIAGNPDHVNQLKLVNKKFYNAVKDAKTFFENPKNVFAVFLVQSRYNYLSFDPEYVLNDSIKIAHKLGFDTYVKTNENLVHMFEWYKMKDRIIKHLYQYVDDEESKKEIYNRVIHSTLRYYTTYWSDDEHRQHLDAHLVYEGSLYLSKVLKYCNIMPAALFVDYISKINFAAIKEVELESYRTVKKIIVELPTIEHTINKTQDDGTIIHVHDEHECVRIRLIIEKFVESMISRGNLQKSLDILCTDLAHEHPNVCEPILSHFHECATTGKWRPLSITDQEIIDIPVQQINDQQTPWLMQAINNMKQRFSSPTALQSCLIPYIKESVDKIMLYERTIMALILINFKVPCITNNTILTKVMRVFNSKRINLKNLE